jgi:5-methylcytosine-specific restriction endonuclease McrA
MAALRRDGVTEDVGTTKRERLSPSKRLAIWEKRGGICCVCSVKIVGKRWIVEHARALGLGGSNDNDNLFIAHVACAAIKTREEDMPRITDAKATKRSHLGIKDERRQKIPSRRRSRPISDKIGIPPRRNIFTGEPIA